MSLMSPRTHWLVLTSVILLAPLIVRGHDGPPIPLLVDQQIGPYTVSIWGDPDVGDGTFFIIPNTTSIPDDLKFHLGVQPGSGRLPEATYSTERENLSDQVQFKCVVKFDAQELWRVRVVMQSGKGTGEAFLTVEPTPPGYGRWDLLIYFVPFVAVGFLWVVAIIRKRRPKT